MRRLSIPLFMFPLMVTALATLIFSPVQGAKLEIRQEAYAYRMSLTKDISTETFVITTPRVKPSATTSSMESSQTTSSQNSQTSQRSSQILPAGNLLSIQFDLDSAKLASGTAVAALDTFSKLNIKKSTPLVVTGFTCELGTDEINQNLSKQRAETVASLLRDNGYTVQAVKSKGAAEPVTTDPEQLYLNRRVEIEIFAE